MFYRSIRKESFRPFLSLIVWRMQQDMLIKLSLCSKGQVVKQGTPEEIFSSPDELLKWDWMYRKWFVFNLSWRKKWA